MTRQEAIKILKAKLACMERDMSGTDEDCNKQNCLNCDLSYKQGTTGEQMEVLQMAIDAIEHRLAEPAYQHTGEDWYAGMNCAESELYDLPSAQPDHSDEAKFWKERAEFYEKTCFDLINDINKGMKISSIEINENGIIFTKEQKRPCDDCKHDGGTASVRPEPCEDCVSRKAVIRLLHSGYHSKSMIDEVKELPPVQPEPSTEIQEILDYLDTTLHPIVSPDNWNVYAELYDMISNLTSVHPDYDCVLKQFGDCTYDTTGCSDCVIKAKIKAALSAQPEPQWILCSERLPEDMQFVLLTVRRLKNEYNLEPFISVGYIGWNQQHWWCAHDGECEISKVEVIAWMPLPKVYGGEPG